MNKEIILTEKQNKVLNYFKTTKDNMMIIGPAGTGKSLLVQSFIDHLKQDEKNKWVVSALTGVAAQNINGVTLHSALIGHLLTDSVEILMEKMSLRANYNWQTIDTIIIDEISMFEQDLFDKLHQVGQIIRRDDKRLFGGLRLILLGDFLQLGPVSKHFNSNCFIFSSPIFQQYFNKQNIFCLTEIKRQSNLEWVQLLNRIRIGKILQADLTTLFLRKVTQIDDPNIIQLYTKNINVDHINLSRLKNLIRDGAKPFEFKTEIKCSGGGKLDEKLLEIYRKTKPDVVVCVGTRVMHIINSFDNNLVNGSCGTVIEVNCDEVTVKWDDPVNNTLKIAKARRAFTAFLDGKMRNLIIDFLPLKLCWACTVHKSQGLTLDKAYVHVDNAFTAGQVYTALSRLKDINGLFLLGFNPNKILVDQNCLKFMEQFED